MGPTHLQKEIMSCSRGCCDSFAEHVRSIKVASPERKSLTKVTVDDHDTHTVEVKQHWQDRQDVTVKPRTVGVKTTVEEI